jgi:MoaA/NifB/PqqE/SkfB family radical SAM enzyme
MLEVLEPACDVKPSFSVTWEITLKCNLDCSYCSSHNNTIPHPPLNECLETIDFIYEYIDLYMKYKNDNHKHVTFNIFGGEGLFHPNIVEILEYAYAKHKEKNYDWTVSLSTITNAIVKEKVWEKLIDYFGYFTVSYHSESTIEDQNLFRENVLKLKNTNKQYHVSVLMHPHRWDSCINMINWCKENEVKYLVRQLDDLTPEEKFAYTEEQASWFFDLYGYKPIKLFKKGELVNLTSQGRKCCGGQPFNFNRDYTKTETYVPNNNFKDWYCSVNYFFVFVKQVTKQVFNNKDCRLNYLGERGAIGTLDDTKSILKELQNRLENNENYIKCSKSICWCGLCTPKAKDMNTYQDIMKTYIKESI